MWPPPPPLSFSKGAIRGRVLLAGRDAVWDGPDSRSSEAEFNSLFYLNAVEPEHVCFDVEGNMQL